MLTLGINTSGPACDIALVENGATLAALKEEMKRGQDANLSRLVSEACAAAGIALSELDAIGVVTGPGSFTGVRVGVAFARGLALVHKTPCVGVTSLEAALLAGQQGSAIVLAPAQRRAPDITFWAQRFRSGEATTPAQELSLLDLIALLDAHPHIIYGDAPALIETRADFVVRASSATAERAAQLAAERSPDTHPATPTYVRAPDALPPGGKSVQ